jgi:hypothetical protein
MREEGGITLCGTSHCIYVADGLIILHVAKFFNARQFSASAAGALVALLASRDQNQHFLRVVAF